MPENIEMTDLEGKKINLVEVVKVSTMEKFQENVK